MGIAGNIKRLPKIIPIPVEPPLNKIFDGLRKIWRRQTDKTYEDLAEILSNYLNLNISPQRLSSWATGSDNRVPPWHAIYWLMNATGYRLVIDVTEAKLQKLEKRR